MTHAVGVACVALVSLGFIRLCVTELFSHWTSSVVWHTSPGISPPAWPSSCLSSSLWGPAWSGPAWSSLSSELLAGHQIQEETMASYRRIASNSKSVVTSERLAPTTTTLTTPCPNCCLQPTNEGTSCQDFGLFWPRWSAPVESGCWGEFTETEPEWTSSSSA